jgi:Fe-S cluster assembly protein SufD
VAVDLFSPQSSSELAGPEWLRARRAAALAALGEWDLPTTELEEWRYSRIRDLHPERFAPLGAAAEGAAAPGEVPVAAAAIIAELGELAGVVVVHNGVVVVVELAAELAGTGVVFGQAGDGDEALLGAAIDSAPDAFAQLNDAFGPTPVVLSVPRSTTVALPFAVIHHTDVEGVAAFPRLSVVAGENSELSVLEVSLSADVEALVSPITELAVGNAARVRHSSLQDVGPRVWQIGSLVATVGQGATLRSSSAALGGDYARQRTDCRLVGRGAHGDLSSVYFGDGDQMLDLRTFQEHRAPDTTSNLLFKGAVGDRSHSVYTGLIRIKPEARGTNAVQTNRNLKLSDDAWAESVPNLEIENNDVHCSHASTVGPVDEDQRFYLESRGVPTSVADRLIVGGFFDEVLDDLPVPQLAEPIRSRLDVLLDRQMGPAHASPGGPS